MPTGYTAPIADGINFNQFVLGCARAFGACIDMRDEPQNVPIPEEFKPSDYHQNAELDARTKQGLLLSLTADQVNDRAEAAYKADCQSRLDRSLKNKILLDAYKDMLDKVERWSPPSSDHDNLKKFMIEQINESIKWDCADRDYKVVTRISNEAWLAEQLSQVEEDIKYHVEKYAEEIERVKARNKWVAQLRASLDPTKE
jgi:hypothetical protein